MTSSQPVQQLTIRRPDDWHVHLRDGELLNAVAAATARQFARAIVMPNLRPPVTTTAAARAYRERIMAALRQSSGDDQGKGNGGHDNGGHGNGDREDLATGFTPLMTAYLTETIDPADLERGFGEGVLTAVKLYPAGATTNSDAGVRDIGAITAVLETLERIGMPLLIHGEVTDGDIDIFDREAVFIERVLDPLLRRHPGLKVVLEHITTADAADYVRSGPANLAATITPHHLHINRNALFAGGLRPDMYCLPVAKRELHRIALRAAATSGSAKFFLGTDSAPHPRHAKESSCGCAGIYNAPYALESYVAVFEAEGALDRFEAFASEHGPRFYGLPLNDGTVTLARRPLAVPERVAALVPFHAGETLGWQLLD